VNANVVILLTIVLALFAALPAGLTWAQQYPRIEPAKAPPRKRRPF
jgi:hypothetical protein